jgi:prephenate dehydrogenase
MVVIGVGLIGGSLALDCRKLGLVSDVVGVGRNPENLDRAVSLKVIDRFTHDATEAVRGADLVVLATPVGRLLSLAEELAPHLSPGTLVTDVGSVKGRWVDAIERVMPPGVDFVGGHPVAGREKSGVEAASLDLFRGARCIVTPTARTSPDALSKIEALWSRVGATVIRMDPDRHDQIFAAVSHLPHVAA